MSQETKKKKNYQSNLKLEEMIFTLIFPAPLWGLGLGTIHILSQQVSNLLKSFWQVVWWRFISKMVVKSHASLSAFAFLGYFYFSCSQHLAMFLLLGSCSQYRGMEWLLWYMAAWSCIKAVKQAPNKTISSVLSNRPNIHQNLSMSNKDCVSSVKSRISTVILMRCAHKGSTQERSLVKIYLEYVFSVKMMLKAQENNDLQMSASCRNIASSFPRVCLHRF